MINIGFKLPWWAPALSPSTIFHISKISVLIAFEELETLEGCDYQGIGYPEKSSEWKQRILISWIFIQERIKEIKNLRKTYNSKSGHFRHQSLRFEDRRIWLGFLGISFYSKTFHPFWKLNDLDFGKVWAVIEYALRTYLVIKYLNSIKFLPQMIYRFACWK